jgi:hypothetical protein
MIHLLILIAFIIYMTGYGQGGDVVWFYLSLPVLYKPRASEAPFRTLVLHPRVPGLTVPQVSLPIQTLVLHPRVPGLTVPQLTHTIRTTKYPN